MKKIEWNKVTWYSKAIALAVFVIVSILGFCLGFGIGYIKGYVAGSSGNVPPLGSTQVSYYQNVSEWQTLPRSDAGFSIAYPLDFDLTDDYSLPPTTQWRSDSHNTPGKLILTISIPKAFEPQTNFNEAKLTIGSTRDAKAVLQCLAGEPSAPTSTVTINGASFVRFETSDAGAGNLYKTTSYNVVRNGQCYAIEYILHSSQIMNYPAEYNLKPYDEAKLKDVLDRIVGTFKFL